MASTGRKVSLRTNIYWSFSGNVLYAACQWGMLTIIAKVTDAASVGQFSFALALTAPIFSFVNLQLRGIQATDVRDEFSFPEYFRFRLSAIGLGMLCVTGLGLVNELKWDAVLVVYWVGIAKAVESISDVIYGLLQKHEQMGLIAQSLIFKGVLSLLSVWIAMAITKNVVWGAASLSIAWGCVLVFFDVPKANAFCSQTISGLIFSRWVEPWSRHKKLFVLALPMGIVIALNTLYPNIPRYFVVNYWGESQLGYFSAIGYVVVAGTTVVNAVGQAATPRLAKYFFSDTRAFYRLLAIISALALIVGVVGVGIAATIGDLILGVLYTVEYSHYDDVLVWIMIGGTLLYLSACLGCGLTAARKFRVQAYVAGLTTLAVIVFGYLQIPDGGIVGASKALAQAYAFRCLLICGAILSLVRTQKCATA